MRVSGECVLVKDEDGWTAEFPQFGGVATSGRTREEALRNAQEVLELEAGALVGEGRRAPRMAHVAEVAVLTVEVSAEDAERMRYVTKAEAAERLDVTKPRVSALVASGQLATKEFDGRELVSLESIAKYAAGPRKGGRPRKGACVA